MISLLTACWLLLTPGPVLPPPAQPTLTINVQNMRQQSGRICVALYTSGEGFPGGKPKELRRVPVKGEVQQISFTVEPGDYAVAIFQDVNDNGKLDTRLFGIPKEPYGFSNNFHPRLSAPKFSDCRVTVKADLKMDIRLID
jgi:uncharacterized protein (DUF2141 family)